MTIYSAYIKSKGGGALILLQRILLHLAKTGSHVIYSAPEPFPGMEFDNVTFLPIPSSANAGNLKKALILLRIVSHARTVSRKYDVDVAIAMDAIYAGLFAPLKKKHTKILTYIVGNQRRELILAKTAPLAIRIAQAILRHGLRISDTVLSISNDLAASSAKIYPAVAHKTIIQPGALPEHKQIPSDETALLRSKLNLDKKLVITFVGPLMPIKRIDLILKALPLIAEKMEVKALIVGSGNEMHSLEALTASLHIEHLVHFAGWQSKPLSYMAASDIIVLPSDYEGFGLVLLEALSVNKLIIGSRTGGIPDIINSDDLLFTPGDHKDLARCILNAVDGDGNVRDELLDFCKNRAKVFEFDWKKKVTQHIQDMLTK